MIRLRDDWRKILLKAWSVRFILLAALFSVVEVFVPLIQPYLTINPFIPAAGAALASGAAFVARIVAQKEFAELAGA